MALIIITSTILLLVLLAVLLTPKRAQSYCHYAPIRPILGKGPSVHSLSQLEWYKNDVNDKLVHVSACHQRLTTLDGFVIPLTIKDGLARLDIWPHMDHLETFPHVFLTSKVEWDPTVLDHEFTYESQWGEDNPALVDLISTSSYNEFGQYHHCIEVNKHVYFSPFNSDNIDDHID
jgi:hypothetical protein